MTSWTGSTPGAVGATTSPSGEADTTAPPNQASTPGAAAPAAAAGSDGARRPPTRGETVAASVAVLGGVTLSLGVMLLVRQAHNIQRGLADRPTGGSLVVSTVAAPAAGGLEKASAGEAAPPTLTLSGPDQLHVDSPGMFTVSNAVGAVIWSVTGLSVYEQNTKDPQTFVLTPREVGEQVTVTVSDGGAPVSKSVVILPAVAAGSLTIRLLVRNWGLVVVGIIVIFGATSLGLTGHLDGGNFVALVAPLAALLGVTAVAGGRSRNTVDTKGEGPGS
jgi:hypothetical protein